MAELSPLRRRMIQGMTIRNFPHDVHAAGRGRGDRLFKTAETLPTIASDPKHPVAEIGLIAAPLT